MGEWAPQVGELGANDDGRLDLQMYMYVRSYIFDWGFFLAMSSVYFTFSMYKKGLV